MALDGAFLRHIKKEIETVALGLRVDKIYQPNKEEIVFWLRSKTGTRKLLMSTRANSARVHFTEFLPENPAVPPMLCMLFRKNLLGAKLVRVRQPDLERVLFFDFDARNELGDVVLLSVVVEIMGRHSNIILVDSQGKIIDALKRVYATMSSKRQVLPGKTYILPPKQDKLSLLENNVEKIAEQVNFEVDFNQKTLSEALSTSVKGISTIICSEIEFYLKVGRFASLFEGLSVLKNVVKNVSGEPFIIYDNERPSDFSFLKLDNLSINLEIKEFASFSALLDDFFAKKDSIERMRTKSYDLRKQVDNIMSRLKKKIKIQTKEMELNKSKDNLKLQADLISANLYRIKNGVSEVILENFYDENSSKIKIKLNPLLSPVENVNKLYKSYKKSKVAVKKLSDEIQKAKNEIAYLETVLDELDRAVSETDLVEIKSELCDGRYVKLKGAKNKKNKLLPPIKYDLHNGFKVLVGRNNRQNDMLTLKLAAKKDLWFHVKDFPGAHTILVVNDAEKSVDDDILSQTAQIAAYHSKAQNSSNVPVDFALVKDVKKPAGAQPGMVIYNNYKTLYVTPDETFMKNLDAF